MMLNQGKNQVVNNSLNEYLHEQISELQAMLSQAIRIPEVDLSINFPTLKNFYVINNVYKSSWAIYISDKNNPKLLYSGNFLIQGGNYPKRSLKSPFGANALSSLSSIAHTFSQEASIFKQNWTLDLNLFEEDSTKLLFSVKEYQEFLKLLNLCRMQWLLHLSEEGNFDMVITEISSPSDPLFFMNLENFDSGAANIETYFKPISEKALTLFQKLSSGTEFEGKFYNLQPGTWVKDDVLIEIEKLYPEKFFIDKSITLESQSGENAFTSPFKVQTLRASF